VDYLFVSQSEFADMIARQELLEYAIVYNDYKGIPKNQVRDALASGLDVVMRVDVQGAETVRALSPDALLIFLSTRTEAELVARLQARQTETAESLKLRIATAVQEMKRVEFFDYFVLNPELRLDDTVDTILAIIQAEHHRTHPRRVTL
jgi:guanylate kinase